MAQLAEEQARYVDGLADRSAEEQIVALGFMDQAKSTQALGLAQLAAASSSAAMQASTSAMIAEIAAADPQLRAMLVSMGLITETPTGITVNFGDVEDGNVAIDNLTAAINSFAAIIAEAFGIDIVLNDAASGPLANILNTLNALDGKTSTVYINTVGGGLTLGAATGTFIVPDAQRNIVANVPGMSTGGHLRLVGEAGPELVSLPSGSTVTNAAGTRGRLDPMGRRRGNQGASVVYKGNVIHQTITVEESTFADRTRRVMGKRRIG
jgi:NAD(P)-dependent dehydrogenase (short-subunit alcohol dehydrogenase family)